ncbi:cellulose biosynthesis protein BcsQ [Winslowiella iniecta]|uniref:Cell division protein n=1 Tax=Winslowiella iniecta TaxID=1560201 RepID=A0A0L7T824_9GAMM|nr:cellulose biosynthesis protein BcsQ [Winslowiella iniecta]KOC91528.1 cell division protein [Winslowiella iniecta]KOC94520.1 cell division protein [Winslowiella iniecta]
MPIIALQGLRGGTGTSSVTAALAWAVNQLGETVLAMDFSSSNQLAMHFNVPVGQVRGWMRVALDNGDWQQSALRYQAGLDVVPFGLLDNQQREALETGSQEYLTPWLQHLTQLKADYHWLLLDVPAQQSRWSRDILAHADHIIRVVTADANCQIRLHQSHFSSNTFFLLNQFNAISQSQQDLQQLWLSTLTPLIPVNIHRDEAVAEALLFKQPVGEYRPESLAAEEFTTLANWLLINFGGARR